jgi:DNA-binding MarR family transcriptional regulator
VADEIGDGVEALQEVTRVLAGVALRSVDVLQSAVSLPQFRMLTVLADLGQARSARVATALGLEPSTMTRLVDRLVAAGHVSRVVDPGNRSAVILELTASGHRLVADVAAGRQNCGGSCYAWTSRRTAVVSVALVLVWLSRSALLCSRCCCRRRTRR